MSEGGEKMQQANELRERMIQEFAESYMEKLFYFCLKKTGNQVEAEDLTQEIALQIIGSLNSSFIGNSFFFNARKCSVTGVITISSSW